jgi:tRNA nucleotidyltransferase (CCA-adding enzyme)
VEAGVVRALHARSFVDDPTRNFRAVRYAARLGFEIERETMEWMREGLAYVSALSGARVRRELELMLLDESPGVALERADALGLLTAVHPGLGWPSPPGPLSHKGRLSQGRGGTLIEEVDVGVLPFGFAVMASGATVEEAEAIVERVRLRRGEAEAVRGVAAMRGVAPMLRRPEAKPSGVVMVLNRYPPASVAAFAYTTADEIAAGVARTYLADWRHVRPLLRGDDLIALGVPEGPQVQKGLSLIRASRLDGWSGDEGDERALALRFAKSIRDSAAANSMIELRLDGSNKGYRDDN